MNKPHCTINIVHNNNLDIHLHLRLNLNRELANNVNNLSIITPYVINFENKYKLAPNQTCIEHGIINDVDDSNVFDNVLIVS